MRFSLALILCAIQVCLGLTISKIDDLNGFADHVRSLGGLEVMLRFEDKPRIVGGLPTNIEQFPWIVSLQRFGSHRCGASIISNNRVITAAHCTNGIKASTLRIRAGSSRFNTGGTLAQVSAIRQHEKYDAETISNDISVLELATKLSLASKGIASIALPAQGAETEVGVLASVAGWGSTSEGSGPALQLRWVQVPIISNVRCNSIYKNGITDGMLCAYKEGGGKDSCQGDSGGPMTIGNTLTGIVSFGRGCARPLFPGVYTRVSQYRHWIDALL